MKLVRESLIFESEKTIQISAGLVIIQNGTILLGHPKNQAWWGTYSIPKGQVEEGEDLLQAAIRETRNKTVRAGYGGMDLDPQESSYPRDEYHRACL